MRSDLFMLLIIINLLNPKKIYVKVDFFFLKQKTEIFLIKGAKRSDYLVIKWQLYAPSALYYALLLVYTLALQLYYLGQYIFKRIRRTYHKRQKMSCNMSIYIVFNYNHAFTLKEIKTNIFVVKLIGWTLQILVLDLLKASCGCQINYYRIL